MHSHSEYCTWRHGEPEAKRLALLEVRNPAIDEAERWLQAHPGLGTLPPEERLDTGEDARPQSTERLGRHDVGELPSDWVSTGEFEEWFVDKFGYAPIKVGGVGAGSVEGLEMKLRLDHCWDMLLPEHREVLELHVFQGMSHQEVADAMGLRDRHAARLRIEQATTDLRRIVEKHWDDAVTDNLGDAL